MSDGGNLPGVYTLVTTVEVAVPRSHALEAAHVLRVPPPEEEPGPRPGRAGLRAIALLVVILLLLLAGFAVLSRWLPG